MDTTIKIDGFDELMYALHEALDLDIFKDLDNPKGPHPLVKDAIARVEKMNESRIRISQLTQDEDDKKDTLPNDIQALRSVLSGGVSEILLNARLESDSRKQEEIYQKGLKSYPENAYLLASYAYLLYTIGKPEEGDEKYSQAVRNKPDYPEAHYNWGIALVNLARQKTGNEAEKLYQSAFEKYDQAVALKSDYPEAYNNWGTALRDFARQKAGKESEESYRSAFEKYSQAVTCKPYYPGAYYNWEVALGGLAQQKTGCESEELYRLAFDKYYQAVACKSDYPEAYNNWGGCFSKSCAAENG